VAVWEGERGLRHLARLRKVAREAAVQSRRARLPEVSDLVPLAALLEEPGAALADPAGEPPSLARPTIVVGPEGGFTAEERSLARGAVRLGPNVLRAETAAIAAGALLVALREGVVRPP
jgi:16S rRNA (uracil1498-N3)-methyltransferase